MQPIFKNVKYLFTTHDINKFPNDSLDEIAIVGKSNVGKSTLINLISNNKKMAYISSKPGKTRGMSLFDIDSKFRLIDLPGYGYAKVNKQQLLIFGEMMEKLYNERKNLVKTIILIDVRRSLSKEDIEFIDYLVEKKMSFQILGTKLDKANQSMLYKFNKDVKEILGFTPLSISALSKKNLDKLHDYIY